MFFIIWWIINSLIYKSWKIVKNVHHLFNHGNLLENQTIQTSEPLGCAWILTHSLNDFQAHISLTIFQTIPLSLVTLLMWFFFARIASCPSKQCLWSIPSMLIATAPLMMRQQTRPGRNISSARSQQTRSHLSRCSLGGSQALTLLWPRGRENGSSIWFRETLASGVTFKLTNTSFFSSPSSGIFIIGSDGKLSYVHYCQVVNVTLPHHSPELQWVNIWV